MMQRGGQLLSASTEIIIEVNTITSVRAEIPSSYYTPSYDNSVWYSAIGI